MTGKDVDLSTVYAVCNDCARSFGFVRKDKVVGVWMDECGICHQRKPCTDLHHDWNPPKRGRAKCKDGDIEPKHCEYYGEPNGCNSPIYGEHPTAEKSSIVGDAAALREALEKIVSFIQRFRKNVENYGIDMYYSSAYDKDIKELEGRVSHARATLAKPPRNCDRPECATTKAAQDVWRKEDGGKTAYYDWLLAPATGKEGGNNAD